MNSKKILAYFLSVLMIISMLPTASFAAEVETGTDFTAVEEHEHDFETNEPALSEDGTTLIYTCAVEGCEETYEEPYVPSTQNLTSEDSTEEGALSSGDDGAEGNTADENDINEDEPQEDQTAYVAQVGENKYGTLEGAIEAAGSQTTIELLQNITESITIPAGMNIILNLNGFTLTNTSGNQTIHNKGTLSISGGQGSGITNVTNNKQAIYNTGTLSFEENCQVTISRAEGTNGYVIYNAYGASMTIEAPITITSASTNSSCVCNWGNLTLGGASPSENGPTIDGAYIAVKNDETGILNVTGGTQITGYDQAIQNWNEADISGGTMYGAVATWAYSDSNGNYAGHTTISGGTIHGGNSGSVLACWYTGTYEAKEVPTVSITGGTINGDVCKLSTADGASATTKKEDSTNEKGSIVVTGGTFSSDVSTYCGENYVSVKNLDGTYGITSSSSVASSTDSEGKVTYYESLSDAVQADGTVVLLKDIYLEEIVTIPVNTTVILDLNGKEITVSQTNGRSLYAIDNKGTLTLKDSSEGASGSITARGIENFGTMYMQSGKIASCDSNGGGAAVWNEGTFTMTGGVLTFTGKKSGNNAGSPFINASSAAEATITGGQLESPYTALFANAGTVVLENITLSTKTDYWMAAKSTGGTLTMKNVTINAEKGGCLENAGGTVILEECTFNQSNVGNPAYNSSAVAVSNGGTITVKSGTYQSSSFGAYVYNSGGTINIESGSFKAPTVLKADNSTSDASSVINVSGGDFKGEYSIGDASVLSISGGTFDDKIPEEYCAGGFIPTESTDENGKTVYGVKKGSYVAEISNSDENTIRYETLESAIDAIKNGETITLLSDVTLADNTPLKIVDKGSKESPVTLDLNGHTISGSNSNTSYTDSTGTPGSILWVAGSYMKLLDSSEEEKGGIKNTFDGSKITVTLLVKSTDTNGGALTIDNGVKIINANTANLTSRAIYFYKNVNTDGLTLTIDNAEICSHGLALYTSKTVDSGTITINGGKFTSTGKANTDTLFLGTLTPVINGGTFSNWKDTDWSKVAKNHSMWIETKDQTETFTVTVKESNVTPEDYVAYMEPTEVYRGAYLISGDLYDLHNIQTPAGRTIQVKKSASYTFPEGKYFGNSASNEPGSYLLTLNLGENVTLSGGMSLYSADIVVQGNGKLAEDFQWNPAEKYIMTVSGTDNQYSCRLSTEKAAASLTKSDGTMIYYTTVGGALVAAKTNTGSKVTMFEDYSDYSYQSLSISNNVVADYTLDLNGHTYTYTGAYEVFRLNKGAKLTVTDSSVEGTGAIVVTRANAAIATTGTGGTIIIEKNAKVQGTILLDAPNSVLEVAGTVDVTGLKTMAISGNGTIGKGNTTINIKDGAKIIADSTGLGIYHPQSGTMTITGDVEISGGTGIEMRAGTLNIMPDEEGNEPKITATGEFRAEANGSGTTTGGVGIAIAQHTTKLPIDVNVEGGNISGKYGLYEHNPQGNDAEAIAKVKITIADGAFTGEEEAISSQDCTGFVSGGKYSSAVKADYCANGYVPTTEPDENNQYTVINGPKMYGRTLTLDGTIGVNFYVDMSNVADETDRANYSMEFTVNGRSSKVSYDADACRTFDDKVYYRFTCPVAAKQMTDTITAQLVKGDAPISKEYTYSVKAYYENAAEKSGDESLVSLLKAMLNYGGYAQKNFGYREDDLANDGLYEDTEDPVAGTIENNLSEYALKKEGEEPDGINLAATLFLESDTVIRFYLSLEDGKKIEDYSFTIDGKSCSAVPNNGSTVFPDAEYYIEAPGVAAQNLGTAYTLTVNDSYSVSYSALTYAYNTLENTGSTEITEDLKNVVKALYFYNAEAKKYNKWLTN